MDAVKRLWQRMLYVIGRGRITFVDDSGNVQLVQINFGSSAYPQIVDAVPNLIIFGHTSNPPVGSDAGVAFIAGDRANGYVVGFNSQAFRLKNLKPGESATYDAQAKYIKLGLDGITIEAKSQNVVVQNAANVSITASGTVTIAAPNIALEGAVTITGDMLVSGTIIDQTASGNAATLGNLRATYDEHTHQVANVASGTSTATTNPPTPSI
jgi:phage baseplate assembly protein V